MRSLCLIEQVDEFVLFKKPILIRIKSFHDLLEVNSLEEDVRQHLLEQLLKLLDVDHLIEVLISFPEETLWSHALLLKHLAKVLENGLIGLLLSLGALELVLPLGGGWLWPCNLGRLRIIIKHQAPLLLSDRAVVVHAKGRRKLVQELPRQVWNQLCQ